MDKFISRKLTASAVVAALTICSTSIIAAPIVLNNHGFETGDLSGWDFIGDVVASNSADVTTDNGTVYSISPFQTHMAYLNSQGATVTEIEEFLGIQVGSLFQAQSVGSSVNDGGNFEGGPDDPEIPQDVMPSANNAETSDVNTQNLGSDEVADIEAASNGNYSLNNGSAISQSFFAEAGDTISMSWNYVARDYTPYTDPSFAILVGPNGETIVDVLATTTGPGFVTGSDGISGVFQFTEELTEAGEYTIAFAVTNSEDTVLNSALFLDNGTSLCEPNCNEEGSPENPLLPEEDDTPDVFDFTFEVTEPSTPIFIDPIVAIGYDYVVHDGPNVASVILPSIGDGIFDLYGWDGGDYTNFLGSVNAGVEFDFGSLGVDRFRVSGIEVEAGLDPTDSTAFITGLTFVSTGTVDISQTPISIEVAAVPAPSTLPLIGLGLLAGFFMRRKRK